MSERQKQSTLSVEEMGINAIKETPAANFYEGLGAMKGVDLTSASIGFRIINTRGFNSTSPVRSLQIIDGVDNQSPGLNFSLGNFLGASELDVESVQLIQGASSAYYGPNAFNGVISMRTKNPFIHKGLSVQVKAGERNLGELALRYAKAIEINGVERIAFKLNAFYLTADDWEADNLDATEQSVEGGAPFGNPGGWDAVNRYGDENLTDGRNNDLSPNGQIQRPGIGRWHRTGYEEVDLVDYDTRNLKLAAALHFKLGLETELIASSNYSNGTTVYQGDNRISLKDIQFFQHRLEIQQKDKWFIRSYMTHENAGNTYDAVFTAFRLQEASKNDNDWTTDYRNFWTQQINPRVRNLEGFPELPNINNGFTYDFDQANAVLAANQDSLNFWHSLARARADNNFFQVGTAAYDSLFNQITTTPVNRGGTLLVDRSALYHLHGEYKFTPTFADFIVGANGRLYTPKTDGTIFKEFETTETILPNGQVQIDTTDIVIRNFEFGVYGGIEKKLANDKLRLNGTFRVDKNQNFDFVTSVAASAVWTINDENLVRASFGSAVRNPTLADQYLFYNVGRAILVGNIEGRSSLIDLDSFDEYRNSANLDTTLLERFDVAPVQPEKVRTIEFGYRGTFWNKFYIDANYYYSTYRDFLGFNLGLDVSFFNGFPNAIQAFRVAANATDVVTTQGFSIGGNYYIDNVYSINGNYTWNILNSDTDDPIIPAYNTPENKFNIGISGRNAEWFGIKNIGFSVNYKWIQGFQFEGSPQFTGFVPTYDLLDVQLNKAVPKWKTIFKLGASNLLNNRRFQVFGGPSVGRMGYFSVTVDIDDI
ncbi:MAG: TonB-dependent receptor [Bacteroidota bacterium]